MISALAKIEKIAPFKLKKKIRGTMTTRLLIAEIILILLINFTLLKALKRLPKSLRNIKMGIVKIIKKNIDEKVGS